MSVGPQPPPFGAAETLRLALLAFTLLYIAFLSILTFLDAIKDSYLTPANRTDPLLPPIHSTDPEVVSKELDSADDIENAAPMAPYSLLRRERSQSRSLLDTTPPEMSPMLGPQRSPMVLPEHSAFLRRLRQSSSQLNNAPPDNSPLLIPGYVPSESTPLIKKLRQSSSLPQMDGSSLPPLPPPMFGTFDQGMSSDASKPVSPRVIPHMIPLPISPSRSMTPTKSTPRSARGSRSAMTPPRPAVRPAISPGQTHRRERQVIAPSGELIMAERKHLAALETIRGSRSTIPRPKRSIAGPE
ncbi:MAG: hypothetical protein M1814_004878 [Vezdaea aestivalis]|nr:MAG: hypothetical protein M1814_004878 [Vezdaea aestivalis]